MKPGFIVLAIYRKETPGSFAYQRHGENECSFNSVGEQRFEFTRFELESDAQKHVDTLTPLFPEMAFFVKPVEWLAQFKLN